MSISASGSSPVSRGVNRSDSTIAFRLGCEVRPDIDAIAPSAMSRPTSRPLQDAGGLGAADVVGVEVDRDADLVAQRLDQLLGGVGLAQARPCP